MIAWSCRRRSSWCVAALFGGVRLVVGAAAACRSRVLVGLAFTTPIFAFTAAQEGDNGFNILFRLDHHAADALLRHLLPDRAAARVDAAGRVG